MWRGRKREGMRSRAAYKLMEIDDELIFEERRTRGRPRRSAGRLERGRGQASAAPEQGRVVAIDILAMDPIARRRFRQPGFLDPKRARKAKET